MNELVFLKNEQPLTTSLKVAKEFNKRHDNVIRDIQNLGKEIDFLKFEEIFHKETYLDSYGQIYWNTKQTLENYSRLSLIPERFLPA